MTPQRQIDLEWLTSKFPSLSEITPLTQGGQKTVLTAADAHHGPVVLKLIHPGHTESTASLERVAVENVGSPRVPQILDHGTLATQVGECLWLIERQVQGQSLREEIKKGALSPSEILRLAQHMLEALAAAEDVAIVHRDVKPDNIIRADTGDFWLLDFGIARHLSIPTRTPDGPLYGKYTPGYAPPEQFLNNKRQIDSRSDLFALAVTLFEAATGVNPFREGAQSAEEVLRRVRTTRLPALRLSISGGDEFKDLVTAMGQPNRLHRPRSAKLALEWLNEIVNLEGA